MTDLNLPKLKEGFFWRIKPAHYYQYLRIQIRKKLFIGSMLVNETISDPVKLEIEDSARWILQKTVRSDAKQKYLGDYSG